MRKESSWNNFPEPFALQHSPLVFELVQTRTSFLYLLFGVRIRAYYTEDLQSFQAQGVMVQLPFKNFAPSYDWSV